MRGGKSKVLADAAPDMDQCEGERNHRPCPGIRRQMRIRYQLPRLAGIHEKREDGRYGNHRRSPPQILRNRRQMVFQISRQGYLQNHSDRYQPARRDENGGKDAADNIHRQDAGLLQDVRRVRRNRIRIPEEQRSRITLLAQILFRRRMYAQDSFHRKHHRMQLHPVGRLLRHRLGTGLLYHTGAGYVPDTGRFLDLRTAPRHLQRYALYFGPTYIPIRNNRILLQINSVSTRPDTLIYPNQYEDGCGIKPPHPSRQTSLLDIARPTFRPEKRNQTHVSGRIDRLCLSSAAVLSLSMKMFGRHRVVVGLVNRTVRVLYRSINRIKLQRFIADIYQIYKVWVLNENKN